MPKLNWNAAVSSRNGPGHYLVEVAECEERSGVAGTNFNLRLVRSDDKSHVCYDTISFSERAMGIAIAKLRCLGIREGTAAIEAQDLIKRSAAVCVVSDTKSEKPRLIVDISAPEYSCGYRPATEGIPDYAIKKSGIVKSQPSSKMDENPFNDEIPY